ncbi:helix-turn-helix domain-containing protein [Alsobacter sp. SYSU M60028]|uniref:Helix-turn-helix domain-containing protein n=1 Tax=Alsobacter ponti TaxID=2962936 RepID=A0ABT1LEZ7_9HYPH|nr:helix-turn-helix domain-containing protein [Alsobacter ponti]MCP8940014.1 helix-turn-helix domain-containing protein [Alsobacter ponti]
MSLDFRPAHDHVDNDRVPPKHDARWTLGFSRDGAVASPLDRATRHLEFEQRSTIFDEGDDARYVYVILEGAVMLSKLLPDGRRQIIELLGPGDVFGVTTTPAHDCCAEALRPTRIVAYDHHAVDGSASLQKLITERMKAQLCAMHDHAVLLGRKSAIERVATFLMRIVPGRGGAGCLGRTERNDQANIRVPLTRQEIADYLGLTLETVSRAFSHLKRDGLLVYGRHDEVTICNVCRLCQYTGSH